MPYATLTLEALVGVGLLGGLEGRALAGASLSRPGRTVRPWHFIGRLVVSYGDLSRRGSEGAAAALPTFMTECATRCLRCMSLMSNPAQSTGPRYAASPT